MASNHDPATVERVARATYLAGYLCNPPHQWDSLPCEGGKDVWFDIAVAALDCITELGYGKTGPVYEERDRLVCALSKCFPAHLVDATDASEGWSSVVIIDLPTGQVSWHIADAELPWFAHLQRLSNDWDGHDSATKYDRLSALTELGWRPGFTEQEREALEILISECDDHVDYADHPAIEGAMKTARALLAGDRHG